MNIVQAKTQVKQTFLAYSARTETGEFRIPLSAQRPVLLMGPPGIGKTAAMAQVARECGAGLVSYTMTHHTRQSALGLPRLVQRSFGGKEYTVTEYTMSEIIAAVYAQQEATGCKGGILFLDEFNCVSETLQPALLQFLQYKSFGSHKLPEGWMVAAAGNPVRYNRSARELDTVTLDRVKLLEIEPDLAIWRRYALEHGVHPAILAYLSLRPEDFYAVDAAGGDFVTARGWEDLSRMLLTLEALGLPADGTLPEQYLRSSRVAENFRLFWELYRRRTAQLRPEAILAGEIRQADAGWDLETRLTVVEFLVHRLCSLAREQSAAQALSDSLGAFSGAAEQDLSRGGAFPACVTERLERREAANTVRREHGLLSPEEEHHENAVSAAVRAALGDAAGEAGVFLVRCRSYEPKAAALSDALTAAGKNALDYVERSFGRGQELLILLTELDAEPAAARFFPAHLGEHYTALRDAVDPDRREAALRSQGKAE
jgi:hypothetical protein